MAMHVYSIIELHFTGPKIDIPEDSACFILTVKAGTRQQKWNGYYKGNGDYVVNYAHKQTQTIQYTASSDVSGFHTQNGKLVIDNIWPGNPSVDDYKLGANWFSDQTSPLLFDGKWQGAVTVRKWREAVLKDWAKRWSRLR